MNKSLLLGLWKFLVRIPGPIWRKEADRNADKNRTGHDFMTVDHHTIRDFVVRELPRCGVPISPKQISTGVNLPLERTQAILDDLEKGKVFLFRNEKGDVAWAYPVTAEPTPHRITFSTGEKIFAA